MSGTDIVAVTAPLRGVIQGFVTVSERETFQYVLQVTSYVVGKLTDSLGPIPVVNLSPRDPDATNSLNQYLAAHLSADEVEFWQRDRGVSFTHHFVERPSDQKVIEHEFNQFALFKPVPLMSVRNEVGARMFWSGSGRTSLSLPQVDDLSDSISHKVTFIDPLMGERQSKDVEDVGVHIENSDPSGTVAVVDPNQIKELIVVCFDESSSMEWDLSGSRIPPGDGRNFPRVTIAAQYLTSLANRQFAMNIPRVQGLLTFGSTITVRAKMNPLTPRFEDGIKQVAPAGRTMLWDCLLRARNELLTAKIKYPNAVLRIVVISDGEDTQSSSSPHVVAKQLIDSSIVADAIIVNLREASKPLSALCHLTGGCAFRPDSIEEGLQLFEQEGFLSLSQRPPVVRFIGPISPEVFEAQVNAVKFDKVVPNVDRDETRTIGRISTPRYAFYLLRDAQPTQNRLVRLRMELKFAAIVQDRNATVLNSSGQRISVYDPGLRIHPVDGKIDCWRVFLQGPVGTPYANKWWYLTVTFPPNYPEHAPMLRFISVPFHINISSEGQICLPFLTREYLPSTRAVELIQQVREVLVIPNVESPVQLVVFDLYRKNRQKYDQKVAESCQNAKNSPEEWMAGLRVADGVPSDFSVGDMSYAPQWERSVFTGEPIPRADQVISSTGVVYHREELRRYIAATPNPICPITGRRLVETLASFGGV
jgi:ubiquitin-protein ligase